MSLVVSSPAQATPTTTDLVIDAQSRAALDSMARANFERVTAPGRYLEAEDLKRVHYNPETGESRTVLEKRMAKATWGALLTAYKLIRRADLGRSSNAYVSEESLNKVSLRQPPLDWIVENLTDPNPLLYPGTEVEVHRSYSQAQHLLGRILYWMAQCQIKAGNLEAAGIPSGWDWKTALIGYILPPHRVFSFNFLEDSFESYDPRLPSFDPRLIRAPEAEDVMEVEDWEDTSATNELAVVLHPTKSHYSRHYPRFDPFSGNPQEELVGCPGREVCIMGI
ncbi:hypothetical protein EV360DRAFT_89576 [Lentinula raphanica]|nr:hypothetical protein EV360DRAFT_89576 [Lentinula raphanica]